jgi:hypothetical protein
VSGSVLLTNVSGRRCALTGYLTLRWRDPQGTVMPVSVTHMSGTEPGKTIVIPPGATAFAGIYWNRYRTPDSTATCPPFPATFDVWLPPTVEDPRPDLRAGARRPWVTGGDNASVCGGTVALRPLDIIL